MPDANVSTQEKAAWSCSIPGALELLTEWDALHDGILHGNPHGAKAADVIAGAIELASSQSYGTLGVQGALTHLWGCGPSCHSTSALLDVDSPLARLKFDLMEHFARLGVPVDTSVWGGTPHMQTVW